MEEEAVDRNINRIAAFIAGMIFLITGFVLGYRLLGIILCIAAWAAAAKLWEMGKFGKKRLKKKKARAKGF